MKVQNLSQPFSYLSCECEKEWDDDDNDEYNDAKLAAEEDN